MTEPPRIPQRPAVGAASLAAARNAGRPRDPRVRRTARPPGPRSSSSASTGWTPTSPESWMDDGQASRRSKARRPRAASGRSERACPPQSPVAWSNFITGMDPGGHGIFDFIHRDPKTYFPVFSGLGRRRRGQDPAARASALLPIKSGEVRNLRRGRAFWQILEDARHPRDDLQDAGQLPAASRRASGRSRAWARPTSSGAYGTFNYYTTEARRSTRTSAAARVHAVYVIGNRVEARSARARSTPSRRMRPNPTIDFKVDLDPVHAVAKIVLPDREFLLREKEWSGWKRVRFALIPTQSVRAASACSTSRRSGPTSSSTSRRSTSTRPIPPCPISTPPSYAEELAERFGPFFTKGLPADTSALDNDILDEEEFLPRTTSSWRRAGRCSTSS